MKVRTMIATGATVLALTAGYAMAKPQAPKGTKWVWTEFADVIDGDGGTPIVSFYDGTFTTRAACMKDIRSKIDTTQPPPCPLDGVTDASCGAPGSSYTFYRCLAGLFGTPLQ